MTDQKTTPLIPVVLTAARWKKVAAYLDWHGKDHESELIVDAIRAAMPTETTAERSVQTRAAETATPDTPRCRLCGEPTDTAAYMLCMDMDCPDGR